MRTKILPALVVTAAAALATVSATAFAESSPAAPVAQKQCFRFELTGPLPQSTDTATLSVEACSNGKQVTQVGGWKMSVPRGLKTDQVEADTYGQNQRVANKPFMGYGYAVLSSDGTTVVRRMNIYLDGSCDGWLAAPDVAGHVDPFGPDLRKQPGRVDCIKTRIPSGGSGSR